METDAPPPKPPLRRPINFIRLAAVLLVIAISMYIFSIRDQAQRLAAYGYPGIFLVSLLSNATVLLPAPGILVVFAMGAVFHPFGVALAASLGATLGEISGYLLGFSGQAIAERTDIYTRILAWMRGHYKISYLMIILLAFVPNPFFDLAGLAAGALKIPITRFLLASWIGILLKMLIFAYFGSSSLRWLFGE